MLESVGNTATLRNTNTYKAYSSRRRITYCGSVRLFGHNIKNSPHIGKKEVCWEQGFPSSQRRTQVWQQRWQKKISWLVSKCWIWGERQWRWKPILYVLYICIYLLILLGLSILPFQSFRVRSMIIMGLCRQRLQAAAMSKRKPPWSGTFATSSPGYWAGFYRILYATMYTPPT